MKVYKYTKNEYLIEKFQYLNKKIVVCWILYITYDKEIVHNYLKIFISKQIYIKYNLPYYSESASENFPNAYTSNFWKVSTL